MSKISSTKVNLKDKINDGEIDLSLCELQDVPVKEIAAVRNIYSLDLSTNHLIKLPNNFVTLTHLTKLDLSKNSLRSLPEDFGNLVKLKYLDLYKNEIEYLPLSFHKLKALRWLDLKDNPLTPSIKAITGPCLDAAECQKCAVEIVKFFTEFTDSLNVELKKRDEQRQQSKLAKEQAEQKQRIQEKKKKKKEKKARSNEVADATSILSNNSDDGLDRNSNETAVQVKTKRTSCLRRFLGVLFSVVFLFSLVFICSTFKHEVIEKFVNNVGHVWKLCIKNLPPEAQKLANAFGEQIYKCHECTREIVRNVARGVADAITNSDVFFDHVVYYKNQLYEKINYFYTKYVL